MNLRNANCPRTGFWSALLWLAALLPLPADWRGDGEVWKRTELPAGIPRLLEPMDWGMEGGGLPAEFHGFRRDLNKDGSLEWFIESVYGGSGGADFVVLSKIRGKWRVILEYQGGLEVASPQSGWPKLVTTSRSGGGTFSQTHHEFRGGRYVATQLVNVP